MAQQLPLPSTEVGGGSCATFRLEVDTKEKEGDCDRKTYKYPQDDPKTEEKETCTMKIMSLPVRTSGATVTTCCKPCLPFCLRKAESINLGIQKDIEKVRITPEKRGRY